MDTCFVVWCGMDVLKYSKKGTGSKPAIETVLERDSTSSGDDSTS